jgi:hypothetical protein
MYLREQLLVVAATKNVSLLYRVSINNIKTDKIGCSDNSVHSAGSVMGFRVVVIILGVKPGSRSSGQNLLWHVPFPQDTTKILVCNVRSRWAPCGWAILDHPPAPVFTVRISCRAILLARV